MSYRDLFGQEIASKKEQLAIFLSILIILFCVMISVSFQSIILFISGNSKEIAVKRFLGVSLNNVFLKFLVENIIFMVLCFTLVGMLYREQINMRLYMAFTSGVILIDVMIITCSIKMRLKSFITQTLKGN